MNENDKVLTGLFKENFHCYLPNGVKENVKKKNRLIHLKTNHLNFDYEKLLLIYP